MDKVSFGRSGLQVSAVGLGCNNFGWRIGPEESKPVVHKALDVGITLYDTADYYGAPVGNSEIVLGELLKGVRQQVALITKFGLPMTPGAARNNSRGYILEAVDASLKRLQTDYIDIYMLHWPDKKTPIDEVLRAMDDVVKSGKARYIACSNLPGWQITEAHWVAKELNTHSFIANQVEYSLLERGPEAELVPAMMQYGMKLNPYYPLASGMLTGKYLGDGAKGRLEANFLNLGNRFLTEQNIGIVKKLNDFAAARGHTLTELAMSWLACQPVVCGIIAGATKPEQVEQNVAAVSWKLTAEEMAEVNAISAK